MAGFFKCPVCGWRFPTKEALKEHRQGDPVNGRPGH